MGELGTAEEGRLSTALAQVTLLRLQTGLRKVSESSLRHKEGRSAQGSVVV